MSLPKRLELYHGLLVTWSQKRVVDALLKGQSNKEIAKQTNLEVSTVKFHLGRIFKQNEVKSRLALLRMAK